jgi:tRNA(fMet)-specific endonuclease VapC
MTIKFLLDTCVISDFFKKDNHTIKAFQRHSPSFLGISTITTMEVEYGLSINPDSALKIQPLWLALTHQINTLSFDNDDARAAASIRAYLKKMGKPIGPYDTLLAGTALNRNLIFVTSNADEFCRVPNLTIEDWRIKQPSFSSFEA